ncbi:ABC transporter ATP-binding protein [Metabacillus litoralis]|uniref:ABC transporter ATP-binding protein n=1 Tax=Metabacillus litoralis TaxID=152268 RepID=UPI0039AFBBB1
MNYKVEVKNVYKLYSTQTKPADKLLKFFSFKKKEKNTKYFSAVKDVTFRAVEGETIGILGLNGSGKSTLSNLLSQVIQPSKGTITLNGTPSLIAISAGLNNNLSGMENITLKCMMHGLTPKQIDEIRQDIIDFAELADYIHQPVKNYSSGMRSRLGFAISVHTDPDILIIDEALSVGDTTFTNKCLDKMNEFKAQGKTIFFVSHSASQMKAFCDRIVWMHYGEMKAMGPSAEVVKEYNLFTKDIKALSAAEKLKVKNDSLKKQYIEVTKEAELEDKVSHKGEVLVNFLMLAPVVILGALVVFGY